MSDVDSEEDEDNDNEQELGGIGDLEGGIYNENTLYNLSSDSDDDSDNNSDEEIFDKKFDMDDIQNIVTENHPEIISHNYDEIYKLSEILRDSDGIIIDEFHKSYPILSKYEKTKILGLRAKQINSGSKPLIYFDKPVYDGYLIAIKELEAKKIPFIIKRPFPNGKCEYWKVKDLEII
jgi:DNA-directed RNA polymerase subunit K/omega